MAVYFEWYEITRDPRGRERRRKLRWRMTVPDLIQHGMLPENMGKVFETVAGSGEDRGEATGAYVGWGQALPGAGEVEAAREMGDRWRPRTK